MRADRGRGLCWRGVLVGIGIAGPLDEVVLHQLLGWHHFYDRSTPSVGLLSDGLFHILSTALLVIGVIQLVERRPTPPHPPPPPPPRPPPPPPRRQPPRRRRLQPLRRHHPAQAPRPPPGPRGRPQQPPLRPRLPRHRHHRHPRRRPPPPPHSPAPPLTNRPRPPPNAFGTLRLRTAQLRRPRQPEWRSGSASDS